MLEFWSVRDRSSFHFVCKTVCRWVTTDRCSASHTYWSSICGVKPSPPFSTAAGPELRSSTRQSWGIRSNPAAVTSFLPSPHKKFIKQKNSRVRMTVAPNTWMCTCGLKDRPQVLCSWPRVWCLLFTDYLSSSWQCPHCSASRWTVFELPSRCPVSSGQQSMGLGLLKPSTYVTVRTQTEMREVRRHKNERLWYVCVLCSLPLQPQSETFIILRRIKRDIIINVIFGPRRDEVTGEWRRLHNEELNDLYCSPNIVRVIKWRRMRWTGHMARMGE